VNFPVESAPDVQRGHAGDAFDAIFDLILHQLAQLQGMHIAGDAEEHDGGGGDVEFADRRPLHILGQPSEGAVEAVADVIGGDIEIGAPGE